MAFSLNTVAPPAILTAIFTANNRIKQEKCYFVWCDKAELIAVLECLLEATIMCYYFCPFDMGTKNLKINGQTINIFL